MTSQAQSLCAAGVLLHTPALSSNAVTLGPCGVFDAAGGAVAALAAQKWVVAESLSLAHIACRSDCLRRADAAPCHLVAQSAATFARCKVRQDNEKEKEHFFLSKLKKKRQKVHSRLQWGKP